MFIVYTLILITCLISFACWADFELQTKLIGYPYSTSRSSEWYRLLSAGFLHADTSHLFFNMFALHSFGNNLFVLLGYMSKDMMRIPLFLLIYLGGIIIPNMMSCLRHANHADHYHLGASGGVSAVVAAVLVVAPNISVSICLIPIPGFILLPGYLLFSLLASKTDARIGHLSHFTGMLYGIGVMAWLAPHHILYSWGEIIR